MALFKKLYKLLTTTQLTFSIAQMHVNANTTVYMDIPIELSLSELSLVIRTCLNDFIRKISLSTYAY